MSFPRNVKTIIGIDQTGAVSSTGVPRPLFVACLNLKGGAPALTTNLRIPRLGFTELSALFSDPSSEGPVLVVVDSALGLPHRLGVSFRRLLSEVQGYRFGNKEYGAETAHRFFQQYLPASDSGETSYPRRVAEILAEANSVFQRYPFQKNISCGTFRVLKDLAREPNWFRVWPFEETTEARFVIAEGYPSLFWRQTLHSRTRDAAKLNEHMKKEFPMSPPPATPDDADATMLAIGGMSCLRTRYFEQFTVEPLHRAEGWIAGLAASDPSP